MTPEGLEPDGEPGGGRQRQAGTDAQQIGGEVAEVTLVRPDLAHHPTDDHEHDEERDNSGQPATHERHPMGRLVLLLDRKPRWFHPPMMTEQTCSRKRVAL